jgi:hypothetical protein
MDDICIARSRYLKKDFPRLTYIKSATLVDADGKEL